MEINSTEMAVRGRTKWWRWAACSTGLGLLVVASSAAIARQQVVSDASEIAPTSTDSYPGLIRPANVTTIALPTATAVRQVLVAVGDHVTRGQRLLELDDEEAGRVVSQLTFDLARESERRVQLERMVTVLDHSISALTANLAGTNTELSVAQRAVETIPARQLRDSPERAQAAYDLALAHEQRVAALFEHGIVSRQDLEDVRIATRLAADDLAIARRSADASQKLAALQADQSRAQAALMIADREQQRADRVDQLTQTRLREQQAASALKTATERLANSTVVSPEDGLVAEVPVRAGDRVLGGTTLLKVVTFTPMVVDVDVPPSAINALHRGQPAVIRVSGRSEEQNGRVHTITPLPGDGGAHTVEVIFDNPRARLLSGQTARVSFGR